MFFCEFCKIFKSIFDRTLLDNCFFFLSVNFEKFFKTPLLQSTSGKLLTVFHVQVTEFQPGDTLKYYFTSTFQAFFTRSRVAIRRHSFTQNPKKLSVKKLILNEVARCQPKSLRKKLSHTSSFMYFAFIFSERITIISAKEALKVCEHNFFQEI